MSPHDAAITLCIAAAAGVFLITLADRLRAPSIALLLLGGIALGPEALGWVDPHSLGAGLETVVTLAVAIVLFEGGLTLDVAGFRREPVVIIRLLTVGVAVTWAGVAATVYFVYGVNLELAIIAGSLVIVTGPTVVSPLLRRIGVQPRLHHILYWEGVMVDAVGVFVAVLCYEWIASGSDDQALWAPLGRFASRFAIGAGIGLAVGAALDFLLRRQLLPHEHTNIVVLGTALLALGTANAILAESGILAVIVAGLVLSLRSSTHIKELKRFKLELTEVGIGLLFVLLAARLDLSVFVEDGARLVLVLAIILFALRPLNIALSTWGAGFNWRERAFLSWLAPRGIVAASMASLFALRLERLGYEDAALLETLTYAVIGTTVILQGLTAPSVARILGLQRRSRATWLLIGDPLTTIDLHRKLRQAGARSLVLATERSSTRSDESVEMVVSSSLVSPAVRDPRLADVEAVLALASDPRDNDRICEAWAQVVGPAACYRWDGVDAAASQAHGKPVWQTTPSPGAVRSAIDARTAVLEALEVGSQRDTRRFGEFLQPLLAIDEGKISVVDGDVPPDAGWVVALHQRTPGLYGLVRDGVVIDKHATTFPEVIEMLLELAERGAPGLPIDKHRAEILEREATMPTTVGGGVAIPHVYDEGAEHSSCYAAVIKGGLDTLGPDDEPVRIVFLVVSPAAKATLHLRSLAAIAHIASDAQLIDVLAEQRTRGRLLALLRERE